MTAAVTTTTGERIEAARHKAGLSRLDIALLLGVTETGVARWEQGARTPRADLEQQLWNILNRPPSVWDEPQPPSRREREILRLLSAGLSNEQVARQLSVSPETVKSHVRRMLAGMKASNRAHLVALAYERGYLPVKQEEVKRGNQD